MYTNGVDQEVWVWLEHLAMSADATCKHFRHLSLQVEREEKKQLLLKATGVFEAYAHLCTCLDGILYDYEQAYLSNTELRKCFCNDIKRYMGMAAGGVVESSATALIFQTELHTLQLFYRYVLSQWPS